MIASQINTFVLRTTYLAFCFKFFIKIVLKYTCTLKKIKKLKKYKKSEILKNCT